MLFTEDEVRAKVGERIRVRDGSFSSDGIAKGTTGEVVDVQLQGRVGVGPGKVVSMGKEQEVWCVVVRFDGRHSRSKVSIGEDKYQRSLEEI
jgi:hypothetical protein